MPRWYWHYSLHYWALRIKFSYFTLLPIIQLPVSIYICLNVSCLKWKLNLGQYRATFLIYNKLYLFSVNLKLVSDLQKYVFIQKRKQHIDSLQKKMITGHTLFIVVIHCRLWWFTSANQWGDSITISLFCRSDSSLFLWQRIFSNRPKYKNLSSFRTLEWNSTTMCWRFVTYFLVNWVLEPRDHKSFYASGFHFRVFDVLNLECIMRGKLIFFPIGIEICKWSFSSLNTLVLHFVYLYLLFSCKFTGCPMPEPPENGNVQTTNGLNSGDTITYTCKEGYALVGAAERKCNSDSTWSGSIPSCNIGNIFY